MPSKIGVTLGSNDGSRSNITILVMDTGEWKVSAQNFATKDIVLNFSISRTHLDFFIAALGTLMEAEASDRIQNA